MKTVIYQQIEFAAEFKIKENKNDIFLFSPISKDETFISGVILRKGQTENHYESHFFYSMSSPNHISLSRTVLERKLEGLIEVKDIEITKV